MSHEKRRVAAKVDDDQLIGAVVAGRYRIEQLISTGAMGRVYRARHTRLPRCFALKILTGRLASQPRMRMRFAHEAAVGSVVDHPNLVSAFDFGSEDGVLYLAMDHVEGETLAALIAREAPLEPTRVIAVALQLASGLAHAHERGLVHRDLKPDNILFDPRPGDRPAVRILDFGLAICEDDRVVVGTPQYMAPEQLLDRAIDHRADLFALGVVLYEMLAARPPFPGNSSQAVRRRLTERAPGVGVGNAAVRVPAGLEAVVARLLERDPEDRFATARELLDALAALDLMEVPQGPEIPDVPEVAEVPEVARPITTVLNLASIVALAFLGIAGAGFVHARPDEATCSSRSRCPDRCAPVAERPRPSHERAARPMHGKAPCPSRSSS